MKIELDIDTLDWEKGNELLPAIVQDANSMRVLMLGYVNKEALRKTIDTGLATFYSRSQKRLWQKGETSGNVMRMVDIKADCDNDTLLYFVVPKGPACHKGTRTCFGDGNDKTDLSVLADLADTIRDRRANPPTGSYTAKLFEAGLSRIAQKVGEEGVETALAAATRSTSMPEEAADLLYHLFVLLEASDLSYKDVLSILKDRAEKKGLANDN
ncbi:MAG: bifunctional phosphoribosyl-AMP cyclohydrolase/phosphoribosyl-ATP diphosphatase HisIE [Alphaproteobacteria bacterium]|nr:bifunctional phosphoribosyl-AMP cyclohydrolase/phosphoribosyl-ATP diphosphatase HisIE [Alphaproteobacteria bacterium]